MTQLDAFIYYLERMDVNMLDDILTEDISYSGITKQLFLEKLGGVFEYNASINNKTLAVQKSPKNPNCIEFFCWDNKYWINSFLVKENNGNIVSFIRKPSDDSHNPSIFRIYDDEEIGFVKSADFIITQQKCKNALDLIKGKTLTTDLIINWLSEYEDLHEELSDDNNNVSVIKNIKYLEEFVGQWEILDYDKRLILNSNYAEEALNEFNTIDEQEWLDKYSDAFYCKLIPGGSCAEFLDEEKYLFKERGTIYQSKELFLVNKFTELYGRLPSCKNKIQ